MGDNGSPPLSRRVPGTTSMPRAQVRRSPARLPDSVLERLKAEVQAARAKEAEEPDAQYPGWSDEASFPEPSDVELPRRSKLTAFPRRPRTASPEEWEEQTAAQLPQEPEVAQLPARPRPAPLPQRPKVAPPIERPKLAPLLEDEETGPLPERTRAASFPQRPRLVPQWMQQTDERPEPELEEWQVVPDSPQAPIAESDDITEPIPVVAPPAASANARPIRELVNDQAAPAAPERPQRQVRRSPGRSKPAKARPKRASPRPKPATARPAVASPRLPKLSAPRRAPVVAEPASDNQGAMLQALFSEVSDFDEVVASARAQAGRPLAGVEWRYVMAAAGLAALILVAVVVFMLQLAG
jgi:hypothetical protein